MSKKYPSSIAPHTEYRYRLPMLFLLKKYPNLAVIRRCNIEDPYAYSSSGNKKILCVDALGNNLLEMSVNLLGGCFKKCHLPFVPNRMLVANEWDGKTPTLLPLSDNDYRVESIYSAIYFRVAEVNKFAFPYTKQINKESEYDEIKSKSQKIAIRENLNIDNEIVGVFGGKQKPTDVHSRLHVDHHPNLLNYWHMQIDVYPAGSDEYLKYDDDRNETRRIRHRMKERIVRIAIRDMHIGYRIDKKYYKHGVSLMEACFDTIMNNSVVACLELYNYGLHVASK